MIHRCGEEHYEIFLAYQSLARNESETAKGNAMMSEKRLIMDLSSLFAFQLLT
jgi:hypothetical protein